MKQLAKHIECTLAEYHSRPEYSHSQFQGCIRREGKNLLFDWPLFYGTHIADPPWYPRKTSKVFDDGNVAHAVLTSPGGIDQVVAIIPPEVLNSQGHRKGKPWLDWSKAHEGKIQRTAEEMETVRHMVRNVYAHPYGAWLMEHAQHYEFSLIYECPVTGLPLRARPDLIVAYRGRVLVVDFKTTRCLTPEQFAWDMEEYGYHRQFAWYDEPVELFGYDVAGYIAITVDKSPANECRVYEVPERAIRLGRQQNEEHRRELARRLEENDWTDPLGQKVYQVDLPERAYEWKGELAS